MTLTPQRYLASTLLCAPSGMTMGLDYAGVELKTASRGKMCYCPRPMWNKLRGLRSVVTMVCGFLLRRKVVVSSGLHTLLTDCLQSYSLMDYGHRH